MFGFSGCEADGILAHLSGIEPTLEGEVLLDRREVLLIGCKTVV